MYEQAMLYMKVFLLKTSRLVVLYNDFSKLSLVGMQLPENIYYLAKNNTQTELGK
jgi:hypothetical protein